MATPNDFTKQLSNDPFVGGAIPGQSLTATPGQLPFEKPPVSVSLGDSFFALKRSIYRREMQEDVIELTNAGISCETIAGSLVMGAFSRGMFNADIAETIKPFLAVEIYKIAREGGVDHVQLKNDAKRPSIDRNSLQDLKEEAAPMNSINYGISDEFLKKLERDEDVAATEGFMPRQGEI
jgi:hypothetical protein